jgi:acyl carrier protein
MTDEAILDKLTDIFRLLFGYTGEPLTLQITSDDIEAWDSMANITLAIEIEAVFSIRIKMAEMEKLKSVRDLVALVRSCLPVSTH